MLKRKLLMTILPVLSAAVIAGAGFSAWHFGTTTTATYSGTVNTVVEDATEYSISVKATNAPTNLSLDQGSRLEILTDGINFTDGARNTDLTLAVSQTGEDAHFTKVDFKITITLNEKLDEYLDFNISDLNSIHQGLTTTNNPTDSSVVLTLSDIAFADASAITFALNNDTHNHLLNYATEKKPQTYGDWKNMNTALTGSSMTIGVSVTAK